VVFVDQTTALLLLEQSFRDLLVSSQIKGEKEKQQLHDLMKQCVR